MKRSESVFDGRSNTRSRLIKAVSAGLDRLESFETKPSGVFGSEAEITCGYVTIKSSELDLEFNVKFDDDMEPNEAEIIVYNLSDVTINQLKRKSQITIKAGYKGDTGVLFVGYITKVTIAVEDADRIVTIKCLDDIKDHAISETTYSAGKKASYILKDLLQKTGLPIADFQMRRDHTYESDEKVDGDLMESIKKYSEVCGVSTYVSNGKIYSRPLTVGDNLNFDLKEETGLIGSPEYFEEEQTTSLQSGETQKEYKDTTQGYNCESLLQHRFAAGGIVSLKSLFANGTGLRIKSGEHIFNPDECMSKVKLVSTISSSVSSKATSTDTADGAGGSGDGNQTPQGQLYEAGELLQKLVVGDEEYLNKNTVSVDGASYYKSDNNYYPVSYVVDEVVDSGRTKAKVFPVGTPQYFGI